MSKLAPAAAVLWATLRGVGGATVCPDGSNPTTVTTRIASSGDDAEEAVPGATAMALAVGTLYNTSSDIELGYDKDQYDGNQYIGLRFPGVAVPKNVYIHKAHVAFTVDKVGSCCNETFDVSVKMQKAADAASFAGQASSYLHGLYTSGATTAKVTYTPAVDSAVGDAAATADLSALVQEVVGQAGWASGNAMAVLFGESTGTTEAHSREYESYDGAAASAPALVVEYCPMVATTCPGGAAPMVAIAKVAASTDDVEEAVPGSTAGSVAVGAIYASSSDIELGYDKDKYTGNQYVGLRFAGVAVPPGATVRDARVKFWVDKAGSCCNESLSMTVKMQKAADAPAFAGDGRLNALYTSGATSADVTYTPVVDTSADVHQPRYTPNLRAAVQEVVDIAGWTSGNAMAALFAPGADGTTEANSREYESFDTDPNMAASLYVEYCPGVPKKSTVCPDGSNPTTVTTQIASSGDDAEEASPGATAMALAVGTLYDTSSDIELGYDKDKYDGNQYIGLRFPGVAVPKNVYIHRAHVAFTVDKAGACCNETFDVSVKMQKAADAASFAGQASSYLHSLYTSGATTAKVTYTPAVDLAVGDAASTADLSALVQEVVGQAGWASGNAMAVLFGESTGTTEAHSREYESYDGAAASAPALVVEYCPMVATTCPGGAAPMVAIAKVAASTDDVEEAVPGSTAGSVAVGAIYASSSDIELGYDKDKYTGNQYVGLRFAGVAVPPGADVRDARVKFWVDKAGSCCNESLSMTVKMQKAADAPAFAGEGQLNALYTTGATSAHVTYTPIVDTATDVHQPRYTPNLQAAVQEVVDVAGWASGNAMAALFAPGADGTTEANSREYESFDTDPNMAASLYVEYCPGAPNRTSVDSAGPRAGAVGGVLALALAAVRF